MGCRRGDGRTGEGGCWWGLRTEPGEEDGRGCWKGKEGVGDVEWSGKMNGIGNSREDKSQRV